MLFRSLTLFAVSCIWLDAAPQTPPPAQKKARDLKYEVDETIDQPATGKVTVPRSYALVIGVSQYPNLDARLQLKYTERDAEAIYATLISREGGNFRAENVRRLIGPKATLANIRKELEEWLPSVTREDDRVLVYFAGHGFVFNGKVYLAPSDFQFNNPTGTGYPAEQLGVVFGSKIRGKWKVLLTDACHSGAITSETDSRTLHTRLLELNRSLFSLTASRDREQSFESPDFGGGHGVFTYYVVKGLEGEADESRDGIVTADELAAYVQRNVREATNARQNPMVGGSFDNAMLLAYIPAGARLGAPPPPQFGAFVFETNMDDVEVFVDGKSVGVVHKGKPLRIPGLIPGIHQVKGVHMGYEPDGPREEMIYPGQDSTISLRLRVPRRRPKALLDRFDDAVQRYQKARGPEQYRRAVVDFEEVLKLEPGYSEAALYLARAHRDLKEFELATKYFNLALQIDPDFVEARATYGAMLFDTGNEDEAIRQLNQVLQRDPSQAMAWYTLAQAYRLKEQYDLAIEAGRNAVRLTPNNAEAHFWLAEGLRMKKLFAEAIPTYQTYLKLSHFDSSAAGKLFGYYLAGFAFGAGKKKRAGATDVWREMRALAYFALCNCELELNHFDNAIAYCQKSLSFDKDDPFTHYALGWSYLRQADSTGDVSLLPAARKHFSSVLAISPGIEYAAKVKKQVAAIDQFLSSR